MANEAAEEISYVPDYIKMEPGTNFVVPLEADFIVFKW
jgi:hypothetical protein